MNYEIIKDEEKLRQFIDWLPDTEHTEQYYLCLFARSKYCKDITHIKSDKSQLKRFTSTKDRMFDKIKQLECEVDSYKQYKEGKQETISIPQEALALYITPNPRDLWKATFSGLIKLAQCIRDTNTKMNPQAEMMSEIQKSKGKTTDADFDLDESDPEKLKEILSKLPDHVNLDAVTLLRTRGGVHILVDHKKVVYPYKNKWYQGIASMSDSIDQTGDMMIPVAGCTQGNFIPHFINVNDYANVPIESIAIENK